MCSTYIRQKKNGTKINVMGKNAANSPYTKKKDEDFIFNMTLGRIFPI